MPTFVDQILRLYGRSGLRGANRAINALRPADGISPDKASFVTRFAGLDYEGDLTEHIDRAIFYFGGYALAELDFLREAARRCGAKTFFDVGANVGQHSLWMAKHVREVHAFEPSAPIGAALSRNAQRNELDNIRLWPYALGEADDVALLGAGFDHNSGSRSLLWGHERGMESVRIVNGDAFIAANDLPPVDLLKIDVEGYESSVLSGLSATLARDRPIILVELMPPTKGGFTDHDAFQAALYPNHHLFTLVGRRKAALLPFEWDADEFVCLPAERIADFENLIIS